MSKILLLFNHFAPYRDDIFKLMENSGDYQLKFIIKSISHNHSEWEYELKKFDYIVSSGEYNFRKLGMLYKEYPKMLKKYKPNYVITSGSFITLIYTKLFHRDIKIIYVSDQIKKSKHSSNKIINAILKGIYRLADGIWCTGEAGEKYFLNYVEKNKIKKGCYTNDVNRILGNIQLFDRKKEREKLKILDDDYVFLFIGKLIPSREIGKIIKIAEYYKDVNTQVKFLIVGDGPDAGKVECAAKEADSNIRYIPRLSLNNLEMAYSVSDAYLYLGWEPYSLALYEASIVGLPIIANGEIGATYDCVNDGENGVRIFEDDFEKIISVCDNSINGIYNSGANKMKEFIINERGIKWAANQLMDLLK